MNTREKIVTLEELQSRLAGKPAMLVTGTFDPLLAAHAQRIEELAVPGVCLVAAVVADLSNPILPLHARLEMAAALRMVDFVLPATEADGNTAIQWTAVHDDTALHNQWKSELIEHVRRRNQSA